MVELSFGDFCGLDLQLRHCREGSANSTQATRATSNKTSAKEQTPSGALGDGNRSNYLIAAMYPGYCMEGNQDKRLQAQVDPAHALDARLRFRHTPRVPAPTLSGYSRPASVEQSF